MKKGVWDIQDNILIIRCEGEILIPKADEIYQFVSMGMNNIFGIDLENEPNEIINGLEFSNYPLEPTIDLKLINNQEIYLSVKACLDNAIIMDEDIFGRIIDHIILNGIWYPFIKGSLEELNIFLNSVGILQTGVITLKQYMVIHNNPVINMRGLPPEKILAKEISSSLIPKRVPSFFKGSLYPYQKQGFSWLSYIDQQDMGCILADEMGLGKTIQVIALLANHAGKGKPCMVVSPATLLENWRREIERFANGIRVCIHQGGNRTGFAKDLIVFDVVITSYDLIIRDRYMLKMIDWDIVILDEAQAIKNPGAKRTKAVKAIPRRCSIAMSGTPVQNNLIDLWSISDFALPNILGSLKTFEKEFLMDTDSAKRVEPLISPIMLRRRVDEVAIDLPEKIDIPQSLMMDKKSSEEYEEIRIKTIEEYGNNASFVILQKLRMFCTHPFLLKESDGDLVEESVKYNRLLEILEEIFGNNQKALIFTSWTKMIDILVSDIPLRFGVFSKKIDGRVKIQDRQLIIDEFNSIETPGILVLNPIAGGVGLNITGANHVIHFNLEWNPAVVDQATARAYRKGQTKPVMVHRLFYVNTVEEVINERLELKREIADAAVVGVKGHDEDYQYIINALMRSPKGV